MPMLSQFVNVGTHTICVYEQAVESQRISAAPSKTPLLVDVINPIEFRKELLAIRRIFSLVDMITNTKFSNCPNIFEICVVWQ